MWVQEGHTLETYDYVPENVHEELYIEEQKSLERHQKASGVSAATPPAIHITNMLPSQADSNSHLASIDETPVLDMLSGYTPTDRLNIPGILDEQVKEHCTWRQSRVKKTALKEDCKRACDASKERLQSAVVSDIDYWFEKIKRLRTE
ncbi:hypothetical protein ACMFMG_004349 [Clarireedia jacksonii]